MEIKGQPLILVLHHEALVDIQSFMATLRKKLEAAKPADMGADAPKKPDRTSDHTSTTTVKSSGKTGKLCFSYYLT